MDLGFHHVETARHYGSSERQLGWALPRTPDPSRLLQSKVPPRPDADAFEAELELSFERLGCDRLDLLAIHGINLPVLLWLYNLLEAWDLESYAKARYGLLGSGGHWFAGANADGFDAEVSAEELQSVLQESPWRERIPEILRSLKQRLKGESQMRLSSV